MSFTVQAKVKSFYVNFDYKKLYMTAKTVSEVIVDNKLIEYKQMLVKLNYKLDEKEDLWPILERLCTKEALDFTVNTDYFDTQSNGHHVKQFTVLDIQCP